MKNTFTESFLYLYPYYTEIFLCVKIFLQNFFGNVRRDNYDFFERFETLRKEKGISQGKLEKELGFSNGSISKWKNSTPTAERLQKIADYFDVSVQYLMTGEEDSPNETPHYYLDDDARDLAQFMFENPEYKVLFDASRKVKKEDIEFVKQFMDRMRGDEDDTGC